MRAFAALAAITLLGSCATLSEEACRSGDWEGIGYRDGANGRYQDYLTNHAEACADYGIAPDTTAWLRGRSAGLLEYCTPANVYQVGRRGHEMTAVCQGHDVSDLRLANYFGLRYHEITEDIDDLEDDIDDLRHEIAELLSGDPSEGDIALAHSKRHRIFRLESEIQRLRLDRIRYASLP